EAVNIQVFVDAPYDRHVSTDARFWNASGISFSLDAEGVSVQTGSLAAILAGGVAFARADDLDTESAKPDSVFNLHASELAAMTAPYADPVLVECHSLPSVPGLKVGAPVDLRGAELGSISDIDMEFDRERRQFSALVRARIDPLPFGPLLERMQELDKEP